MLRTLCLSGGGFRATLYHLGVISALRDLDLLKSVREIFSVSGGSITAAHLVLHWDKYIGTNDEQFREIAQELIEFIRADIRGRLMRRWVLLGWTRLYDRVDQLKSAYDQLYKGALLENLGGTERPNISILATSLITGDLCAFTPHGILVDCIKKPELVKVPQLPLSNAVAASSAFPPLFRPVTLDRSALRVTGMEMLAGEVLSDGGVLDNLGIATLSKASHSQLFISDASAEFQVKTEQSYDLITDRTIRSTDILMSRIAALEQEKLSEGALIAPISNEVNLKEFKTELPSAFKKDLLSPSMQRMVKFVRTDLDRFSDVEIDAIYQHGYEVAATTIVPALDKLSKELPKDQAKFLVFKRSAWELRYSVRWRPSAKRSKSEDLLKRLQELVGRAVQGSTDDAPKSDPDELKQMELAGRRKLRLWDARDPVCWMSAIFFSIVALCVMGVVLYDILRTGGS
jgi:predicted acylesterase/phospholipase RssA